MTKQDRDKLRELAQLDKEGGHFTAPLSPAALLALLDRVDEIEAELAAVKVDAERYKDAISDAFTALDEAGEINPSNYDHDHVCQMNSAYCEAFNIIYEARGQE